MSAAVLHEPKVLRTLGRGEYHREGCAALAAGQARRTVRLLELVRRRYEGAEAPQGDIAAAIGRWIELMRSGHPAAVELPIDPFVGIWAAGVLRGERTVDADGAIDRLLAPQLGLCGPWTATFTRAGRSLNLNRCGGSLVLPDLGRPQLVEVHCTEEAMVVAAAGGSASFRAGETPVLDGDLHWEPTFFVRAESDERTLNIAVAESEPAAMSVGPSHTPLMNARSRSQWKAALEAAWRIVVARHEAYAQGVQDYCRFLVPQESPEPNRHVSSTSADGFGAIGLSLTQDIPTLAVALIHETQHLKLSALLDAVTLHEADDTARYYAGWRDEPRPFQALLHGVYAFSAVTEFWRAEYLSQKDFRLRGRYGLEYALWAAQTTAALRELIDADAATPEGREFLAGIEEVADRWNDPVDALIATAVSDVRAEHRLNWELRRAGAGTAITTGIRRTWQSRLTGADMAVAGEPTHIHPVDSALATDDTTAAVEQAEAAVRDNIDDMSNWFRLSRAYAHAAMNHDSSRVTAALVESATRSSGPSPAPGEVWLAERVSRRAPASAAP